MRKLPTRDAGTAIVEFVVIGVLVMVPIAYAALVVMKVHSATFGVVTAAREAGRAYATADTTSLAATRARQAARLALEDQGLEQPTLKVECLDGSCLSPGSTVRVEVTTHVALPLIPSLGGTGATVPVTAVHEIVVDSFRGGQ